MALALAAKVRSEQMTSSPGPTPSMMSARCRAAVPLESAAAWPTPVRAQISCSKASTCGPSGRDPVGIERLEKQLPLPTVEVGRGQIDALSGHVIQRSAGPGVRP